MEHPYRAVRVRAFSDATTRIDLRSARPVNERAGWWLLAALCVISALVARRVCAGLFADGLGYDDAQLRWIAQCLRRAVEAAR